MMDVRGALELRNAIVLQAAYDYEKALRKLRRYPAIYQDWTDELLHTFLDRTPIGELKKFFDAGMMVEITTIFPSGYVPEKIRRKHAHVELSFREVQGKFYRDIVAVRSAQRMVSDCEAFFRSGWYKDICSIDGEWMIRKIREQSKEKRGNFFKDGNTKELQRKMARKHDRIWADIERDSRKSIHTADQGKRGRK